MKISYFRETKSKILSVQCSKVKTGPWEKRNCERKNFGNLTRRKNKRMVNKRFLRTQRCINVFHMLYLSIICSTYWESQKLEDFSGNKMDRLTQKISLSSVFPSPRLSKILTFFHFSRRSGFHLLFIFWEPDTPPPQRTSKIFWPRKPRRRENLQVKLQVGRFEGRVLARSFRGPMIVEVLSS